MAEARGVLVATAAAVADGEPVHWAHAEALARPGEEQRALHQLRAIALLRADRHVDLDADARGVTWLSLGWNLICLIAAVQSALAVLASVTVSPGANALLSLQALITAAFLSASAILILRGHERNGSRGLGEFFLLAAAAFSRPIIAGADMPFVAVIARGPYPEALMAYSLWRFASRFGRDYRFTRFDRLSGFARGVSGWWGIALFFNSWAMAWLSAPPVEPVGSILWRFRRDDGGSALWFWDPLLALMAAAVLAALYRSLRAGDDERRRALWLVAGIGGGLLPIIVVALVRSGLPGFDAAIQGNAALRGAVDATVLVGLLSMPFATAYAVLVRRALPLTAVMRGVAHYALSRYAVVALATVPLAMLLLTGYANRQRPVAELVAWRAVQWQMGLSATGWLLVVARQRIRHALGRIIGGSPLDRTVYLAQATAALGRGRTSTEVAFELVRQACQLTSAESGEVLLRDRTGLFRSVNGSAGTLAADTAWLAVLAESSCLDLEAKPEVRSLLPVADREWIAAAGFAMVARLSSPRGHVIGLLGLRQRGGGWPYSRADLSCIAALAASAGIALDREHEDGSGPDRSVAQAEELECTACGRLVACECAAPHRAALLPRLLANKFEVLARIGQGGMGVVYAANDLGLSRPVALKTLPQLSTAAADAILSEARTMAAVTHPNVALIFGTEFWRRTPVLVVEFLSGGTLAGRLSSASMTPQGALEMGALLADGLVALHGRGLLHRDVKPSNVGFSAEGVPKLLDFGIAKLIASGVTPDPGRRAIIEDDVTVSGLAGTPLYLPPEAFEGSVGANVDVWGLSLVVLEAMVGVHPLAGAGTRRFRRGMPSVAVAQWRDRVPPEVFALFSGALHEERARRPQSAAELAVLFRKTAVTLS